MNAAAFGSGDVDERPSERRRYGENCKRMIAGHCADALLPVLKRSARLIGAANWDI
jgi:hypothetical protein